VLVADSATSEGLSLGHVHSGRPSLAVGSDATLQDLRAIRDPLPGIESCDGQNASRPLCGKGAALGEKGGAGGRHGPYVGTRARPWL